MKFIDKFFAHKLKQNLFLSLIIGVNIIEIDFFNSKAQLKAYLIYPQVFYSFQLTEYFLLLNTLCLESVNPAFFFVPIID